MAKEVRGSLWASSKKGFKSWRARGSFNTKKGDRFFKLTDEKSGKTRVYESTFAAASDGWKIIERARR